MHNTIQFTHISNNIQSKYHSLTKPFSNPSKQFLKISPSFLFLISLNTVHIGWTISSHRACQHFKSYTCSPPLRQYMHHHASHFSRANPDLTSFKRQIGDLSDNFLDACKSQQTNISAVGMCHRASICEEHEPT